tara:strand:- start:171298 stop:171843 length:546 start_codon:yes stop_codon:yes gene_type:complete
MRLNHRHLYFLGILILAVLINSCEQKKSELTFKSYSDKMNKFQIDIPENWGVEKYHNEYSSSIFFTDTTKTLEEFVVFDIVWDSTEIYLNEHFKRSMDSIVLEKGQQISNQYFDSLHGFKTYRFDAIELDTLNKIELIKSHNYIKDNDKEGHLIFTYSRVKKELSKTDSILTEKIMKSIQW